jgi:hypothetical protein
VGAVVAVAAGGIARPLPLPFTPLSPCTARCWARPPGRRPEPPPPGPAPRWTVRVCAWVGGWVCVSRKKKAPSALARPSPPLLMVSEKKKARPRATPCHSHTAARPRTASAASPLTWDMYRLWAAASTSGRLIAVPAPAIAPLPAPLLFSSVSSSCDDQGTGRRPWGRGCAGVGGARARARAGQGDSTPRDAPLFLFFFFLAFLSSL